VAIRTKHLAAPAGAGVGRTRSIPGAALLLAFAMWMVWSVLVVHLPAAGFDYSTNQLFWLTALPGLAGATLRLFCAFMVPIFGGRKWTAVSTAALLAPALGIGFAVQDPATGYPTMLALALLCGVGGGNLAASGARGLDAGLGAFGAPLAQLVAPLAISAAVFGAAGGRPQAWLEAGAPRQLWLQNAGFIWVPFILIGVLCAWFGMREPALPGVSFAEQSVIFRRKHNWIMCWLCSGALGSFLGYAAAFPLLLKTEFPAADPLAWAFIGPLAGVLARAAGAGLAHRTGAARVMLGAFCLMAGAVLGLLHFLPQGGAGGSLAGFFGMSVLLFGGAGCASAGTERMIPLIFKREGGKESAAVLGFTSALAAYGAFFIPKSLGSSIALTGSPGFALWCFAAFYASCVVVTWHYYIRKPAGQLVRTDYAA
jgi:NNP family nitrate/nitrite transporter-like MFS transporter